VLEAKAVRRLLLEFHHGRIAASDRDIDGWLGLDGRPELTLDLYTVVQRCGHHRLVRGDIPYAAVRALYRGLSAEQRQHVLDLGSGYGRIVLYGALVFDIHATGVEIVAERNAAAENSRMRLGLNRARFIAGDALDIAWPPASCVCIMNSFLPSLWPAVIARLDTYRAELHSAVVAIGGIAQVLADAGWAERQFCRSPSVPRVQSPRIFPFGDIQPLKH
jgi:SAM-dependent methyltransferase